MHRLHRFNVIVATSRLLALFVAAGIVAVFLHGCAPPEPKAEPCFAVAGSMPDGLLLLNRCTGQITGVRIVPKAASPTTTTLPRDRWGI